MLEVEKEEEKKVAEEDKKFVAARMLCRLVW